jgi:hypothetical protein
MFMLLPVKWHVYNKYTCISTLLYKDLASPKIPNSMEQTLPWESDSCSSSQILRLLWIDKVHYHAHKSPPLVAIPKSRFLVVSISMILTILIFCFHIVGSLKK